MCEPWDADAPGDLEAIQARLAEQLRRIRDDADARAAPSTDMVREWHRVVHAGLTLPEPYYAGEVRDSDPRFPCLTGYEVRIGALPGVPSHDVPNALRAFENGLVAATSGSTP